MVRFVRIREAEQLTGLSRETLKKMRLSGQLTEGLEWVRHNKRLVLYNTELLASFIQHRNDPEAVQRVRHNYLRSLLSNQKVRNRRAI